jgi:hypothetical protein
LPAEVGDLVFEVDDALGASQRHAFAHQSGERCDVVELGTAVTPLPAWRTGRADDAFGVEAADEGRLHVEHRCGLADREERGEVVGDGD